MTSTTIIESMQLVPPDAVINKKASSSRTFEGKVVSLTGNKLVMSSQAGTESSHTLAADAQLTCDGLVCQAEDLKAGNKIRVTTKQDDRNVATGIESLSKQAEFVQCR